MKSVVALIMAGDKGERLMPLTRHRCKPAIHFGGIYLLTDLPLSNCINSEIYEIIVLPQYKAQTLMEHLEMGWNIFNPDLGHYLKIAPPQMMTGERWYQGTADSIRQDAYLIEQGSPDHVLILSGDHVYKMDYGRFKFYHEAHQADVTISVLAVEEETASGYGILEVDEEFRVRRFVEKRKSLITTHSSTGDVMANMGVYIFKTEVLMQVLKMEDKADFGQDILPHILNSHRVIAYP